MTRKRFIKLLMGEYCMDRNTARRCAEYVQRRCGSYLEELFKCEITVRRFSAEYGIPRSILLFHEKGFNKQFRRFKKTMRVKALAPYMPNHDGLRLDFPDIDEWSQPRNLQVMSKADHDALHGGTGRLGKIYEVSLVADGGYPIGGGNNA